MAEILRTGYNNLSSRMIAEVNRGESFHIAFELYAPNEDEIFLNPERALFRFSPSLFTWRNRTYQNKIRSIPELTKFIGKQFNTLAFEMVNVARNSSSGSAFVFNNLIRGFRVAVRIIFPNLGDCLQDTRIVWWGRVERVEEVNENAVRISCSQEIGNFSYEVATDKYASACGLWFGRGECLGYETFEQKSALYKQAFNQFGQGGCNRTNARCKELQNERFYQGQNIVTVTGQFIREEITKKKILWIFTIKKKNRIPVQWSSKNQSDNDDINIPLAFGRVRLVLHAFTWADIGTSIIALMGACKGPIEGFYQITSHNPDLPIGDITQHKGELGGQGTQFPDPRFPDSGYNSRLAHLGVTFTNSLPEDEPEEVPDVTAVVKATLIPVPVVAQSSSGVVVPPVIVPSEPPPVVPSDPPVPPDGGGGGGDIPFPGGGGGCPRLDQYVAVRGANDAVIAKKVQGLTEQDALYHPYGNTFYPISRLEVLRNVPIWEVRLDNGAIGYSSGSHPLIRHGRDNVGTRVDSIEGGNGVMGWRGSPKMAEVISTRVVGHDNVMLITMPDPKMYLYGDSPDNLIACHNNKPRLDEPIIV